MADFYYSSSATDTRGVTRTGKDGTVFFRRGAPGVFVVRVEGRDMLAVDSTVTVALGTAVTADFKLEWIDPGPVHLESTFSGDLSDIFRLTGGTS